MPMQDRKPDLDVQPEDWERQSSEPTDLGSEFRVNKAVVDERIKHIQAGLKRCEERVDNIESELRSIELIETIQGQLKPYEAKLTRMENEWKSSVKWWVLFTLTIVGLIIAIFGRN